MFFDKFLCGISLRVLTVLCILSPQSILVGEDLALSLRTRVEIPPQTGRFWELEREEKWSPASTAVIVCDMWDSHSCKNAVLRVEELVPRMNELLHALRDRGVTIIHAPSDCMEYYKDHPGRILALETPKAKVLPPLIGKWCYQIPSEEQGLYPLDQSDGGNDDDPEQKLLWQEELLAKGLKPMSPWKSEHPGLDIKAGDYVSDRGDEVWSILEHKRIRNVMIMGVHTNMCVLGRPFGLRNLSQYGKNVVLVRDMTDTMYNPNMPPYVNHFSGTDLIIEHIEKYVCPTISSDQILGGHEFRFSKDLRATVLVAMAEPEYKTEIGLTEFARKRLWRDHRVVMVYGRDEGDGELPGFQRLKDADLLLLSIRRRPISADDMAVLRDYLKAGKPIVGIRTANHAFSLRNGQPVPERFTWDSWDSEVFGGSYTNHYGADLPVKLLPIEPTKVAHPILVDTKVQEMRVGGSLYKVAPLNPEANVLLTAEVAGKPAEPIAWTFKRSDGGNSVYTSLGHEKEFEQECFIKLLENAIQWGLTQ